MKCYQDVFCPMCGRTGQLKHMDSGQFRVDHYKKHKRIGAYHGKWESTCYLGTSVVLDGNSFYYPEKCLLAYARRPFGVLYG